MQDLALGSAAVALGAEASGIPLGGIGTGSVEVRSDGHFHSATAWGEFTQSGRRFELYCRSGDIAFQRLRLNLEARGLTARLNGRRIPCTVSDDNGYRALDFGAPISLGGGGSLAVSS